MESVEKLIFGKKDTIITLTFASKEDGRTYDVALRRHIPIQTWDSDLQWYDIPGSIMRSSHRPKVECVTTRNDPIFSFSGMK